VEYHTVNFTNDASGLRQKNAYSTQMANEGWHINTETVEAGHMRGGEACCLFVICAPLAFLAGRTPGYIVTTFAREYLPCPQCAMHLPTDAVFCRNCGSSVAVTPPSPGERVCNQCGMHMPITSTFCSSCGTRFSTPSGSMPPGETEKE